MDKLIFWGVIASPYQLKMQALADYAEVSWQRWPAQASWLAGLRMNRRLEKAKQLGTVERFPVRDATLDEYPSVPFYTFDGHSFYYDSTGLAGHLDQAAATHTPELVPTDPALGFVCQLIDEAFDEFGLYMVHHNRWVTSARTNCMGRVTGAEMGRLFPFGLKWLLAYQLPRRQVRRCPYLFSVAPANLDVGMPAALTPPSRECFPATHALLDVAWRQYLAAMEMLLQHQPFLLGERFTLADASAYGQLSMNLIDGRSAELLEELAPLTFQWLCNIRDGGHRGSRGDLYMSEHLQGVLAAISQTFVPLMQQNAAAHTKAVEEGETLFNERAFNRGRALYDGTLQGQPFRAVVKTFQVAVWRKLCRSWQALPAQSQQQLRRFNVGDWP